MAGWGLLAPVPLLLLLVLLGFFPPAQGSGYLSGYRPRSRLQRDRHVRNIRPNIILFLTDDQDMELGKRLPSVRPSLSVCASVYPAGFVFTSQEVANSLRAYPTVSTRKSQPNAASWHQNNRPTQSHVLPLPTPPLLA